LNPLHENQVAALQQKASIKHVVTVVFLVVLVLSLEFCSATSWGLPMVCKELYLLHRNKARMGTGGPKGIL
jgi:hypothetical protein